MFVPEIKQIFKWEDYTLLLPVISVGNVGQLTADLIISTLCMDRVGYIMHDAITPAIGNNPFADAEDISCKLTTCCEVYENSERKIMIIQQRAPLIKGRVTSFIKCISQWIKERQFLQVIIIGSTFSHERLDQQLQGAPFRVVRSKKMEERAGNFLETMGWRELEPRPNLQNVFDVSCPGESSYLCDNLYMPGSGIAKPLFESLQDFPVLLILMFCSEGDNAPDAIHFAHQLNEWLNLVSSKEEKQGSSQFTDHAKGKVQWKIPTSWKHVYGAHFDKTLFH